MSQRRFDWALRSRGPDLRSWPAAERDAAVPLLRASEDARNALADALAEAFDPHLDHAPPDGPERAALRRMGGFVHRALRPPPPVLRGMRWGAVAACLAAGLWLGVPAPENDAAATISLLGGDSPAVVLAALD